jgi:PAS domain S-box-containing protein
MPESFDDQPGQLRGERALPEGESVFRSFFDAPGDMRGIVEVVSEADVRHVADNAVTAGFLGLTPEAIRGKLGSELGEPEEVLRRWIGHYEEARRTGRPVQFEYADPRGVGQAWLSATVSYLGLNPAGEPRFAYVVRDVTSHHAAEEALRESEERFRVLFEGHGAVMLLMEPESGQILDANEAAVRFYGYSRDQLRGMRIEQINQLPPEEVAAERRRAAEHGKDMFVFPHRLAGGEVRIVEVYSTPVTIQGRPTLFSIIHDVTARKQAEEELERTRGTLAEAQQIAHVGSFEYIAATGTTLWSEEEFRIYGLDPAGPSPEYEVMLAECIHPDDAALLHEAFTKALESGSVYELEHRIVRPDGSVRWVYDRARPYFDAHGSLLRYVGATQDITERKLAEAALLQSSEDLDRAQAVAQIGWWRLDTRENVLTWSDENYRIFGLPIGTPLTYEVFLSVVHPDDRDFVDARWQAGLRGEPYDIEHRLLVEGLVKWVREKAYLEHDEAGRLLGGFGITQDVTGLKLAEHALRESEAERAAQRERARLARDLHDSVTQALFAATLKAEALVEGGDPAQLESIAEDVLRLSRGALAQMRTLLLELRGDALAEVPIGQLLRNAVEATESRAGVRVTLTLIGECTLPPNVHEAVYRIAQEALNNVVRHAKASNAWVELETGPSSARLLIGDDGCGFDPASVDPSHFGLRSMRERSGDSGGRLAVESVLCEGTVLKLEWRFEEPV